MTASNASSMHCSTHPLLGVAELRDMIIELLPLKQIFVIQRVCKDFTTSIRSIAIRRKLLLAADPTYDTGMSSRQMRHDHNAVNPLIKNDHYLDPDCGHWIIERSRYHVSDSFGPPHSLHIDLRHHMMSRDSEGVPWEQGRYIFYPGYHPTYKFMHLTCKPLQVTVYAQFRDQDGDVVSESMTFSAATYIQIGPLVETLNQMMKKMHFRRHLIQRRLVKFRRCGYGGPQHKTEHGIFYDDSNYN
ncbi:hypothetical protein LTR97_012136 [Elasticomyces elasticus]|uniref:F-box domain-containing protein n=1 Tax=Elasticomyces elasticus TaxID=574655 RepID=A0AAN7VM63_9PEZI|nr:hypothetical protein LTR97_012136 [Elasticomyces elasticus]